MNTIQHIREIKMYLKTVKIGKICKTTPIIFLFFKLSRYLTNQLVCSENLENSQLSRQNFPNLALKILNLQCFLTGMQIFCDDSSALIITDLVLWTQVQRCPSAAILVGFDEKNDLTGTKMPRFGVFSPLGLDIIF